MTEIRVNRDGLMERPTRYDKCVLQRAAELALPEVKSWLGDEGFATDNEIMEDLIDCIDEKDGFSIAEKLKSRHHWDCDSELVEIMDGGFIHSSLSELEKQWVKCLNVKLDIPIGTPVKIKSRNESGIVVKLYPETAKYGVHTPEQKETSNWILLPEDVEVGPDSRAQHKNCKCPRGKIDTQESKGLF
jgi:hypothetical protein